MVDLYWHDEPDGKTRWLYAGVNSPALAFLEKRKKWWSAHIFLPGCSPEKEYGPLEMQVADVEAQIQRWFGLALTSRPALENEDAE